MTTRAVACVGLMLAVAGCSIVDPKHYQALRGMDAGDTDAGGTDTGMDTGDEDVPVIPEDAPMAPTHAETCGGADALVIASTTRNIMIDTNMMRNDTTATCVGIGGVELNTIGNDAFLAIDVAAGEYWHFHLRGNPADPTTPMRNPALYLLTSGCDPRACEQSSDICTGPSDEHFAFVASSPGRWYLGIDDATAGGGWSRLCGKLQYSWLESGDVVPRQELPQSRLWRFAVVRRRALRRSTRHAIRAESRGRVRRRQ